MRLISLIVYCTLLWLVHVDYFVSRSGYWMWALARFTRKEQGGKFEVLVLALWIVEWMRYDRHHLVWCHRGLAVGADRQSFWAAFWAICLWVPECLVDCDRIMRPLLVLIICNLPDWSADVCSTWFVVRRVDLYSYMLLGLVDRQWRLNFRVDWVCFNATF
jgi:hypothetical protein